MIFMSFLLFGKQVDHQKMKDSKLFKTKNLEMLEKLVIVSDVNLVPFFSNFLCKQKLAKTSRVKYSKLSLI